MTLGDVVIAAGIGIGAASALVGLLKVVLPLLRRVVPAAITVAGAVEASQARLIAAQTAERIELERRLAACQAQLVEQEST